MTNAEGRNAFIAACEKAEHADPVRLPENTPVMIGGLRFRPVYDVAEDTMCFITEAEWQDRLRRARTHKLAASVGEGYAAALHAAPARRRIVQSWLA